MSTNTTALDAQQATEEAYAQAIGAGCYPLDDDPALTQPQVPSGEGEAWQIVPRELTDVMRWAMSGKIPFHGGSLDRAWEAALATAPAPPGNVSTLPRQGETEISADDVANAMESGGYWRSCSGCYESNEGYPNGPYSKVFRTHLGIGCRECGGLGAVWEGADAIPTEEECRAMLSPSPRQGVDVPEGVKEFAREIIRRSWQHGDVDGADVQELAETRGLITQTEYDPTIHGESEFDQEPGDPWFVFSALLARSDAAPDAVGEALREAHGALTDVNNLVAEAAGEGFNYKNGDWPERLYASQQRTSQAIKQAEAALARAETSQGGQDNG